MIEELILNMLASSLLLHDFSISFDNYISCLSSNNSFIQELTLQSRNLFSQSINSEIIYLNLLVEDTNSRLVSHNSRSSCLV